MTSVPEQPPRVVRAPEISIAEQQAAWHATWALLFRRRAERLARLAAAGAEPLEGER
jgi:hypothetical protein